MVTLLPRSSVTVIGNDGAGVEVGSGAGVAVAGAVTTGVGLAAACDAGVEAVGLLALPVQAALASMVRSATMRRTPRGRGRRWLDTAGSLR